MKPEDFTVEHFEKLRDEVIERLEWELWLAKKLYNGKGFTKMEYYNALLLNTAESEIRLESGIVDITTLDSLLQVGENDIGSTITLTGVTYESGRYDIFKEAVFRRTWYEPKQKVPMQAVKSTMKKKLNKMFLPKGMDSYSFMLDCNLMKLFKEGKLPMEDVVRLSAENCEI